MPFKIKLENYGDPPSNPQLRLLRSLARRIRRPKTKYGAHLWIEGVLAILGHDELKAWRRRKKAKKSSPTTVN